MTVPAQPTSRLHEVTFGIRIAQTTPPPSNSVIYVSLRQGTTAAGTLVNTTYFPFVDNTTIYGHDLIATFYPTGLVPGATYCLTTGGDSAGRWTVKTGSWIALYDVT